MPAFNIDAQNSIDLKIFEERILAKLGAARSDAFFDECKEDFRQLLESSVFKDLVDEYMGQMLAQPEVVPVQWQVGQLQLIRNPLFSLSVSWFLDVDDEAEHLHTTATNSMLSSLSPEPLEIDFYSLPKIDQEIFQRDARLAYSHRQAFGRHEIVQIEGSRWVVDIVAKPATCVVTFATTPLWTQIWSFDRSTLQAWRMSASTLETTQLREILGLLRRFRHEDASANVSKLYAHRCHDIRWEAIKTLGHLDITSAINHLKLASEDLHPEICTAARQMLASLNGDN
jgi:hypothetical protein